MVAAGTVAATAGSASAYANQWVGIGAVHGVGVYASPWNTDNSNKIASDLLPSDGGDAVRVTCWTRGLDINNQGNVWYESVEVYYTWAGTVSLSQTGYEYGAYVDGNAWFHANVGDECAS
jgi:hypothetical protein